MEPTSEGGYIAFLSFGWIKARRGAHFSWCFARWRSGVLFVVDVQSRPLDPVLLVVWSKTWRAQLHCLLYAMHMAELANHEHMMVLLAAEGKIEGFHLHCRRKLEFFFVCSLTLLNLGIQQSSSSKSELTVTLP